MEVRTGKGGAVCGDQQVGVFVIGRGVAQKLELHGPVAQGSARRAHARAAAGADMRRLLRGEHSRFIVGRRFALLKGDRAHGAGGQAVAQTVAEVLPRQTRLAVHNVDRALVAGFGTQAAAVAFFPRL